MSESGEIEWVESQKGTPEVGGGMMGFGFTLVGLGGMGLGTMEVAIAGLLAAIVVGFAVFAYRS